MADYDMEDSMNMPDHDEASARAAGAPQHQALQRMENPPPAVRQDAEMEREITPAQARVESVAAVLDSAYRNASTLKLSPEEAKALMAEFSDDDIRTGARGDDRLIYLEHQAVRRRLLEVFGPGQWTIINRRSWLDEQGGWLYADTVLVCRGCFVGECIGAMRYTPKNSRTNYADAVKGAESDALGRIAGTALGVGLQLWSKGFSEGWHERQRNRAQGYQRQQSAPPTPRPQPAPKTAPQSNVAPKPATSSDVLPKMATEARRKHVSDYLDSMFGGETVDEFFNTKGWGQAWGLKDVPATNQALSVLVEEINNFIASRQCPPSDGVSTGVDIDSENMLPPEIGETVITVPRKGMKRAEYMTNPDTIQSLYSAMKAGDADAQKRLWGMAKSYNPEPWVGNDGKKHPPSQGDVDCRIGLDLFLDWHDKNGGGDDQS
jgi:hypothetical protein